MTDMWKANNIDNYPTKVKKLEASADGINTRAITSGKLKEVGINCLALESAKRTTTKKFFKK